MDSQATYTIALAISLGMLGGMSSHATWLIKTVRELANSNKTLSISKKAVKARTALLIFSFALGGVAGFVTGLIANDQKDGLTVVIASAFVAGYAFDSFFSKLGKLTVTG